jgi:hypothetical protein
MGATKSRTSIWSATTLTAGAGDTTSSVVDLSSAYGAQINIKLTNGGTGPTVAAQVQAKVANDYNAGSPTLLVNFGGAFQGGTTNSGVYYCSIEVPVGVSAIELVAGSNTGQDVTVDADISIVTAL